MKFRRFIAGILALVLASTLSTGMAQALSVDLITNGDFEAGKKLTGWTTTKSGKSKGFKVNDGKKKFEGKQKIAPISGNYDVVSSQKGVGLDSLTQYFTVPDQVISATFTFTSQVMNSTLIGFVDPIQEFRVNLINQVGDVISEIYSTGLGDVTLFNNPKTLSFDLTSLIQANQGNQLGIQFESQNTFSYMNVSLDDIALMVETPAEVPLPPSIWMMLAALGLFGFLGWRRRDAGNSAAFTANLA